ncbi:SPOR domain-containing protein [Marinomonas piezotolerans]|uniref:SPOR domain-containing protein n=1 Tax=Marinomonas piezotolerans TaxID=2213058 RepID=A0A370U586_9GAMM|nr:SPOR domain-containing protein [Marinomonas piezotolerans]RDL42944.1 SPOR domain-containing protein [Marinomonas piezotolerans]
MKWVFLLLVLVNAAFFGWQGFAASETLTQTEPVYAPPVSERVYLSNEVRPIEALPNSDPLGSEADAVASRLESALEQVERSQQSESNVVNDNANQEGALLCPIVVLERDADRRQVETVLNQAGLAFSQNDTTGKREKYWLYIAAPETQKAAEDIVLRLKVKKIDSYIIARGEMKNRISLGLYSSLVRAKQAQTAISERSGMPVKIYEHERTVNLYELMLDQPIREIPWQNLMDRLDFSKLLIKIEKNPC